MSFEITSDVNDMELTSEDMNLAFIDEKFLRKTELNFAQFSELKTLCDNKSSFEKSSKDLLKGFFDLHPLQKEEDVQGSLELMYNLQSALKEITGMSAISLQPANTFYSELAGMMIIKKYFENNCQFREKIIIPEPVNENILKNAELCKFEIVELKLDKNGQIDIEQLKSVLDEEVAAIVMSNPNSLGLFEENILEISHIMHKNGSLMCYDSTNFNEIMDYTNPSLMGFDISYLNLHNMISSSQCDIGAGAIAVCEKLKDFLPTPVIEFDGNKYYRNYNLDNSIGSVKAYYGNFSELVKIYEDVLKMDKNIKQESLEKLDEFVGSMLQIAKEVDENPQTNLNSSNTTNVEIVDKAFVEQKLDLNFKQD